MSMTVEDIRANKKLQAEAALEGNYRERRALQIHALWTIAEVLAEIRDVMRFEAGLELEKGRTGEKENV